LYKIFFSFHKLKQVIIAILLFNCWHARAQLFDNPQNIRLVRIGVDYIYNVQSDSAQMYIDSVALRLPDHPAVPMMQAMNVLWQNIPVVTVDSVFKEFSGYLKETVRLAAYLDGGRQEHPEAIFFEMAARGLLAEYYADDGHYMKALSEAGQAYDLIKKGFELSEEVPEFLLTTGVYNYFREKYPEKYPVYKPFLWFFRSGDIELGIAQMKEATEKAVITKVEAYVYLAYVYLRYEYKPQKAQYYLWTLTKEYPQNPYIKAKLLESLSTEEDFVNAPVEYIAELAASDRPYYQMAGDAFWGLYHEKVKKNEDKALVYYQKGIRAGSEIVGHGEYYRYLAYLGLGRIYAKRGFREKAEYNLDQVIDNSEAEDLIHEAKKLKKHL